MEPRHRRGLSAGTVVALTMLVLIVGGTLWVLGRLAGGTVDLAETSRSILALADTKKEEAAEEIRITDSGKKADTDHQAAAHSSGGTSAALSAAETASPQADTFTLTVAGTLAVEENIRKSCYSQDSKKYDFSDVTKPLRQKNTGEIRAVFLENLLDDSGKMTNTVAPEDAVDLLTEGGFNLALCGFARVFDREEAGITGTRAVLEKRGILPLGVLRSTADSPWQIREVNGVTVAMAQYTATVAAGTRKNMAKKDLNELCPEADTDQILADIHEVRARGVDAVIIFLNWGKEGAKAPDKNQIALAAKIADAGADLIIGNGSRVTQRAEMLEASDGSGRKTLCVYSLGTLLSDNRKQLNRMAGTMVHVTFRKTEARHVVMEDAGYTPLYSWRYKQDGKYYYRCLNAGEVAPDGMESDQIQNLEKADALLAELMDGSPLRCW